MDRARLVMMSPFFVMSNRNFPGVLPAGGRGHAARADATGERVL